ncbi:triose-phosphate isomerase [Candidatus Falkowbacteria bacterium]|nr:triose-phosphate isomerase [Candidatus Falkowbacteria bacterium]
MSDNKNEKIIIANWKMKLGFGDSVKLAKDFSDKFADFKEESKTVVACPSLVSLSEVKKVLGDNVKMGAQNVFWEVQGSYTGEISPNSLEEIGCKYVIVGHSERRKHLLENYAMIHQKVKTLLSSSKLIPIVCIGEEADDRKTDRRDYVLMNQIQQALGGVNIGGDQKIVVAYEPVWAIGSGTALDPEEAKYAHKIIRLALNDMFGMKVVEANFKVVYGGSVTSENVKNFSDLEDIDGLLVGGASLDADEFLKICKNI